MTDQHLQPTPASASGAAKEAGLAFLLRPFPDDVGGLGKDFE